MRLPTGIKDAATAAFRDNSRLQDMASADRELAALFYDEVAAQAVGNRSDIAREYNLERARFLRGQVDHIAATAVGFAQEKGLL